VDNEYKMLIGYIYLRKEANFDVLCTIHCSLGFCVTRNNIVDATKIGFLRDAMAIYNIQHKESR
jgi:hypothetical protein